MTVYTALPKAAAAILALPGVESLEREGADWVLPSPFRLDY
jgi:hypothetical protein